MTVMVCIPCLLTGGTEVQTLSLVEALVAAGHKPVVACYFEYAEAMVRRFREAGADVRLMSEDGKRPKGIKATAAHLWKGLRRIIRDCRPNAAHVQYMAPGALPILILRALGVRTIIATAHTAADIYSETGLRVIRFLSRTCLTAFQCITERAERGFFGASHRFDGTLSRHFTIYNNLPGHISIRREPRAELTESQPITVGVVSRLELIKGMDIVVPAFAKAAKSNDRLRLLVVGDGTLRSFMARQASEYGITDRVDLEGRKTQSELQDYYDRIDILLMPSRSEGFGLTAIEGMARGCVTIAAEVGGLPEVVTPDCGLLHIPEDADDLAAKISELSANPQRISSLSSGAIRRAEVFSTFNYREAITSLYNCLK